MFTSGLYFPPVFLLDKGSISKTQKALQELTNSFSFCQKISRKRERKSQEISSYLLPDNCHWFLKYSLIYLKCLI